MGRGLQNVKPMMIMMLCESPICLLLYTTGYPFHSTCKNFESASYCTNLFLGYLKKSLTPFDISVMTVSFPLYYLLLIFLFLLSSYHPIKYHNSL